MWVKDAKYAGVPARGYDKVTLPAGCTGADVKRECFPRLSPLERGAFRLHFIDSISQPSEDEERDAITGEPFNERSVVDVTYDQKTFLVAAVGEATFGCALRNAR